jgi:hypothetical protein
MTGEEADIVIRARRSAQAAQARLIASVIAEMRNCWLDGPRWTADQVTGEAPPPSRRQSNDLGAIAALEDEARTQRERSEAHQSEGWADSFAVDDADLDIDDTVFDEALK